ncbi:Clavaminate synthase-like protein [Pleurostoma richardsiae]|uniref:Clavaminate synthase-like protein n=1 Tax=Pleurostoma richardsiae TaxID=41990 RepID=A0AA38SDE9_9PEZI|nr:Clavaminate synthase-like protein [Pleurostoma richardsiae]
MPSNTEEPKVVHFHAGGVPGSRPILTGEHAKPTFTEIPAIDTSKIFSKSLEERKEIAAQVGKACREVGFFYALNHNVPDEVVSQTFKAVAGFFAQPLEVKMETHINNTEHFRGYEALFETKLDTASRRGDLKEAFSMGEDGTDPEQHAPSDTGVVYPKKNQWPSNNLELRSSLYAYYSYALAFSRQLLHIFALALDMPEDFFDQFCRFPMTAIRALHYPPQEVEHGAEPGLGAHTDYCMFTLVCQDKVPALQVLNDNGIWVDALPRPKSFVVNIGDFLMQVTGGTFQSTVHRVVNLTGERRYSMPFFFSPDEDAHISVLPQFRNEGETYDEISVGEYFRRRLFAARHKHPAVLKWKEELKRTKEEAAAITQAAQVVEQAA